VNFGTTQQKTRLNGRIMHTVNTGFQFTCSSPCVLFELYAGHHKKLSTLRLNGRIMHTPPFRANCFCMIDIFMCVLFENCAGHHLKLATLHLFGFCLTHRKHKKGSTTTLYRVGHMSYYQKATSDKTKSDKHVRNRRILPNR